MRNRKTIKTIKNTIEIIIIMTLAMGAIAIYSQHKNTQRAEYAEKNNCEWVIYSGYELCK